MPTFGYIKFPPLTMKKFVEEWEEELRENTFSTGVVIVEYQKYLKSNEHQHHYGNHNNLEDWLIEK